MPDLPPGVEVPALLFVDQGLEYNVGGSTRFYRPGTSPTRIRATTADGRLLQDDAFAKHTLLQTAADQFGSVVVLMTAGQDCRSADNCTPLPYRVRRLDGVTGKVTWEYAADPIHGWLSEVAIRPDGRVSFSKRMGGARGRRCTASRG